MYLLTLLEYQRNIRILSKTSMSHHPTSHDPEPMGKEWNYSVYHSPKYINKRKRVRRWCDFPSALKTDPGFTYFTQPGFVWKAYSLNRWTSILVEVFFYARGCLGSASSKKTSSLDSKGRVGVLWPLPELRCEEWEKGSSRGLVTTGNLELKFR